MRVLRTVKTRNVGVFTCLGACALCDLAYLVSLRCGFVFGMSCFRCRPCVSVCVSFLPARPAFLSPSEVSYRLKKMGVTTRKKEGDKQGSSRKIFVWDKRLKDNTDAILCSYQNKVPTFAAALRDAHTSVGVSSKPTTIDAAALQ